MTRNLIRLLQFCAVLLSASSSYGLVSAPWRVPARDVLIEDTDNNSFLRPATNSVQGLADYIDEHWPTNGAFVEDFVNLNAAQYQAAVREQIAITSNALNAVTGQLAIAEAMAINASNSANSASGYVAYTYTSITSLLAGSSSFTNLVAITNTVVQGNLQNHQTYTGSNTFETPPRITTTGIGVGTGSNAVNVSAAVTIATTMIASAASPITAASNMPAFRAQWTNVSWGVAAVASTNVNPTTVVSSNGWTWEVSTSNGYAEVPSSGLYVFNAKVLLGNPGNACAYQLVWSTNAAGDARVDQVSGGFVWNSGGGASNSASGSYGPVFMSTGTRVGVMLRAVSAPTTCTVSGSNTPTASFISGQRIY